MRGSMVISTAHQVGLPSSSTMMYGHVDTLRTGSGTCARCARSSNRTGGFTEFVGLPFVHQNAPFAPRGKARPDPLCARTSS